MDHPLSAKKPSTKAPGGQSSICVLSFPTIFDATEICLTWETEFLDKQQKYPLCAIRRETRVTKLPVTVKKKYACQGIFTKFLLPRQTPNAIASSVVFNDVISRRDLGSFQWPQPTKRFRSSVVSTGTGIVRPSIERSREKSSMPADISLYTSTRIARARWRLVERVESPAIKSPLAPVRSEMEAGKRFDSKGSQLIKRFEYLALHCKISPRKVGELNAPRVPGGLALGSTDVLWIFDISDLGIAGMYHSIG